MASFSSCVRSRPPSLSFPSVSGVHNLAVRFTRPFLFNCGQSRESVASLYAWTSLSVPTLTVVSVHPPPASDFKVRSCLEFRYQTSLAVSLPTRTAESASWNAPWFRRPLVNSRSVSHSWVRTCALLLMYRTIATTFLRPQGSCTNWTQLEWIAAHEDVQTTEG